MTDRQRLKTTCDASEKFGPGERFLLGRGGALLAAPPEFDPFRFRRLLAGRWVSAKGRRARGTRRGLVYGDRMVGKS